MGDQLDGILSSVVPARFVSDPTFEWVGSGFEDQVVEQVAGVGGNPALDAMDTELALLLGRFSYYLQGWLSHGLSLQGVTGEGPCP